MQADTGKYNAAQSPDDREICDLLAKARDIQWDYKNLIRRKGRLEPLK